LISPKEIDPDQIDLIGTQYCAEGLKKDEEVKKFTSLYKRYIISCISIKKYELQKTF
jgi:hypothetical protein